MIRSMTAFARQTADTENGQLTWEIRSVNHRYSEVGLRLPDEFRALEREIREKITKNVNRGKLDASLRYQRLDLQNTDVVLDKALIDSLITASKEVASHLDNPRPLSVTDIMRWPGVLKVPEPDTDKLKNVALNLLDLAMEELVATRVREGEQLKQTILARCKGARVQVAEVKKVLPDIVSTIQKRVRDKLAELAVEVDEGRLEQEIVLMANRADVSEEIDRLETHIDEIERVLEQDKPVGRRLDFLMQELNREANTLGSKATATQMSQGSVELKVLIEQMREQIQNIE